MGQSRRASCARCKELIPVDKMMFELQTDGTGQRAFCKHCYKAGT